MSASLDDHERRVLRHKARTATLEALHELEGEAGRGAIRDWALLNGGFTPRELAAPAPEQAAGKFPRLIEHQLAWALTNLKRDGLVENPRRSIWKLAGASLETPAPASDEQPPTDRLAELSAMSYTDYLRTPEWRRTRAAALLRADNCCSLDVTHTEDLEVHHRTYERLGAELASDLVVLCRACHRLHHKEYGRPSRKALSDVGATPASAREDQPRAKQSLLRRLLMR